MAWKALTSLDEAAFCARLGALTELRGKAVVASWTDKVREGRTPEVVLELLTGHYDPMYTQSISRNFTQFAQAQPLVLSDRSPASLASAARALMASEAAVPPAT